MQNSIKLILILFSLILFSSKSNAIISVNAKTAILQDYLSGEILYKEFHQINNLVVLQF